MVRKLLSYKEAKERQWHYEDLSEVTEDEVWGLSEDWYGWNEAVNVTLVEIPIVKGMPVYQFRDYYLPAWLFEGETYQVYVPPYNVAKELEKRYEPEASKDVTTCLGIPASWKGWDGYHVWTNYDAFNSSYLIEGSWWMPYWLICPPKTIDYEVWK